MMTPCANASIWRLMNLINQSPDMSSGECGATGIEEIGNMRQQIILWEFIQAPHLFQLTIHRPFLGMDCFGASPIATGIKSEWINEFDKGCVTNDDHQPTPENWLSTDVRINQIIQEIDQGKD